MNEQPQEFLEWMVTQALAIHLNENEKRYPERMAWLFGLEADTPKGKRRLADLCGFEWAAGRVFGGAENSFKEGDRGNLSSDDFRKIYLSVTPDFRYWNEDRKGQLIVEAKGTRAPVGQRDLVQARRYFSYFQDSGHTGAVIYFVQGPEMWLNWLTDKVGGHDTIPFGVIDLETQVLPKVARELVHVVGRVLVQNANLLDKAMRLSKTE